MAYLLFPFPPFPSLPFEIASSILTLIYPRVNASWHHNLWCECIIEIHNIYPRLVVKSVLARLSYMFLAWNGADPEFKSMFVAEVREIHHTLTLFFGLQCSCRPALRRTPRRPATWSFAPHGSNASARIGSWPSRKAGMMGCINIKPGLINHSLLTGRYFPNSPGTPRWNSRLGFMNPGLISMNITTAAWSSLQDWSFRGWTVPGKMMMMIDEKHQNSNFRLYGQADDSCGTSHGASRQKIKTLEKVEKTRSMRFFFLQCFAVPAGQKLLERE